MLCPTRIRVLNYEEDYLRSFGIDGISSCGYRTLLFHFED